MAALQVQNRLVHAGLDRGRDALFVGRDPPKMGGVAPRLRDRPTDPVARLLPRARPL
jgi:hypothetical protein